MRAAVLLAAVALTAAACGSAEVPETYSTPVSSDVASPVPTPVSTPELEGALFAAVRTGDAVRVRDALAGGADVEARGAGGRTPLVEATKANAVAVAAALICTAPTDSVGPR
ncbi:hypothetical protein [Rhodococcus sp. AG1013]|uniref:hypothetical protein n=1 Tax=unclassified Rhodococcus (in: high G+C Gram-positive bacteria) TaxID=192944 RepID=UPI000E2BF87D|nr:hypothetical protein [Rhodococcus sp. AG1013]RDI16482.1 hypothetical protein DEU38_12674 [Rhodococcus sp. AG1013]